jgi:hypothetical protein
VLPEEDEAARVVVVRIGEIVGVVEVELVVVRVEVERIVGGLPRNLFLSARFTAPQNYARLNFIPPLLSAGKK